MSEANMCLEQINPVPTVTRFSIPPFKKEFTFTGSIEETTKLPNQTEFLFLMKICKYRQKHFLV